MEVTRKPTEAAGEDERPGLFLDSASNELRDIFLNSVFLAVLLVLLALISSRYKRLRVFLATVRQDVRLDTFEILHEHHAAYTLYDIPITFKTVAAVVHLIVVEVLLLALAASSTLR